MDEALELARQGLGRTSPNPAVGAVWEAAVHGRLKRMRAASNMPGSVGKLRSEQEVDAAADRRVAR